MSTTDPELTRAEAQSSESCFSFLGALAGDTPISSFAYFAFFPVKFLLNDQSAQARAEVIDEHDQSDED